MSSGPGGGGKSLELMQRRLKGGSSEQQGQGQQQQGQPAPQQQQPAPSQSHQQQGQPPQMQQKPQSQPAPPQQVTGRPKGKDFSAMSNRPKGKDFSAMSNQAGVPPQKQHQQTTASAHTASKGKKGKDFSVMASDAARKRAQQLHAEARAAAGLPPLVTPTANPSVTMSPPPITPSRGSNNHRGPSGQIQQQQQQQSGSGSGVRNQHQQGVQQHQSPVNSAASPSQAYRHQQHQQHTSPQQSPYGRQQTQHHRQQQQPSSHSRQSSQRQLPQQKNQQHPPNPQLQQQQSKPQKQVPTPTSSKKQLVTSKQGVKQTIQRRGSKTSAITTNRRGFKSAKTLTTTDGQTVKSTEPTTAEGRLSLTAASIGSSNSRSSSKKSASSKAGGGPHMAPLVGPRIADLVKSIDPNYGIEPDAEEQVLQLADDFLDKVTKQAIRLAQHRGSKTLDVRDLQIILAKNFGIVVPGLGLPTVRPIKGASVASRSSSSAGSKSSSTKRNASAASIGDPQVNGPVRKKANTGGSHGGTGTSGGTSGST